MTLFVDVHTGGVGMHASAVVVVRLDVTVLDGMLQNIYDTVSVLVK